MPKRNMFDDYIVKFLNLGFVADVFWNTSCV